MNNYRDHEKTKAMELIKGSSIFGGCKGGGVYGDKTYPFVLQESRHNLYPALNDAPDYFAMNKISWHEGGNVPTGHVLSSQIACLNHLFLLRNDKDAVLKIAQTICPELTDVFIISNDKYLPAYISFEVISDKDHLNEKANKRGALCTSVDALIYAQHKDGKKYLIPIEWKYTEYYEDKDYSVEDRKGESTGSNGAGNERLRRYSTLISTSKQLAHLPNYAHSVYFFEPFYQLMRQTLWAEQMIAYSSTETIKADDYIHVHVIPKANHDLLYKIYPVSGKEMEVTWRRQLSDQSKYLIITPQHLLDRIDKDKYQNLINYLNIRYWSNEVVLTDSNNAVNMIPPAAGEVRFRSMGAHRPAGSEFGRFLSHVLSKYSGRPDNPHITDDIFCMIENDPKLLDEYEQLIATQYHNNPLTLNQMMGKRIKKEFVLENWYSCHSPKSKLINSYTVFKSK